MPDLKPELSKDNKYWIPKHRYYELKHYCLQYPYWKKLYASIDLELKAHADKEIRASDICRANEDLIIKRAVLGSAMKLVEKCCKDCTDVEVLQSYVFKAVTEGLPYYRLKTQYDIPCGKDMYYEAYRKFFFILSQRRSL